MAILVRKGTLNAGQEVPNEDLFAVAQREFEEGFGFEPTGDFVQLSPVKQKAGKTYHAWAFEEERPIRLDEDTRYHDLGTDKRQQGYVRRNRHADG